MVIRCQIPAARGRIGSPAAITLPWPEPTLSLAGVAVRSLKRTL
jgi:hypothetical protein